MNYNKFIVEDSNMFPLRGYKFNCGAWQKSYYLCIAKN